tara:strand:- start:805 stop:2193 length:1389 start_codon:yes stop_codon:yes gene_type:complete
MKRLIFLFLFIFLFSISVNGAGLEVDTVTVDNLIMVGEEAVFDVTITNDQSFNDKVTLLITDLNWEWDKEFFVIESGRTKSFQLKIKAPVSTIKPNRYSLNLKIYSTLNKDVYVYEPLLVTVFDESSLLKLEKIDYLTRGLDPTKETNMLRVILKNQYDKEVDNVEVSLESEIFETVTQKIDFTEAELVSQEFEIDLNSRASEGWHKVNVFVKKGSTILLEETRNVKVGSHADVKEDKEVRNGFLIKKISILKKNEGSTLSEEVYRYRLGSFERVFSRVNPEPSFLEKSGDDYYYVWEFELEPGQTYEIYVEINYRDPLTILIALIIIIYLISYLSESGISVKKRVLTIKSKEGISSMKILIILRNKGKREIKKVRVVDQLFNVKKVPSDYGTLRPSKVKRKGDDVVLVWDGINLVGKEERILSYRVNVGIKASLRLPGALVRYRVGKRAIVVRSNSSLVVS